MGTYLIALPSFHTPTTNYLKSSEQAAFPASNVTLYNRPHQPWKSNVGVSTGVTYVGVDLGTTPRSVSAVIIDNLNVSAIEIQAANDTGWAVASPGFMLSSGTLTVNAYAPERSLWDDVNGQAQGRFKIFYDTSTGPIGLNARRYWRVLARTNTLIDGTVGGGVGVNVMSVGSMICAPSYVTLTGGLSSWGELAIEATDPNDDYAGGGSSPVILGNPYSGLVLGTGQGDRTVMRPDLFKVLRQGIGRWFVVYKNGGDTSEFVICRRVGDTTITQTSPNGITFANFALEAAA